MSNKVLKTCFAGMALLLIACAVIAIAIPAVKENANAVLTTPVKTITNYFNISYFNGIGSYIAPSATTKTPFWEATASADTGWEDSYDIQDHSQELYFSSDWGHISIDNATITNKNWTSSMNGITGTLPSSAISLPAGPVTAGFSFEYRWGEALNFATGGIETPQWFILYWQIRGSYIIPAGDIAVDITTYDNNNIPTSKSVFATTGKEVGTYGVIIPLSNVQEVFTSRIVKKMTLYVTWSNTRTAATQYDVFPYGWAMGSLSNESTYATGDVATITSGVSVPYTLSASQKFMEYYFKTEDDSPYTAQDVENARQNGYNSGYANGLTQAENSSWSALFGAIFDTPIQTLFGKYNNNTGLREGGLLNFQIPLGGQTINFAYVLQGILSVLIMVIVIRAITKVVL